MKHPGGEAEEAGKFPANSYDTTSLPGIYYITARNIEGAVPYGETNVSAS